MKTKVKSPDLLSTMKESAYTTALKADLSALTASDEPQRFFLFLDHKFSDGKTDHLFVVGYSNDWKQFVKDNKMNAQFTAGHCNFSNNQNVPTLNLSLEHGKAKTKAVKTAMTKHSVLKKYELNIVENEADLGADEAETLISKTKPKDGNSKEIFSQIGQALADFKKVDSDDTQARTLALNKIEGLAKTWNAMHPAPHKGEDVKIAQEVQELQAWLIKQKQNIANDTEHAKGAELIDTFVELQDDFKTAKSTEYGAIMNGLGKLLDDIKNWLPAHADIAKGNQDAIITKQYSTLSQIAQKIPAVLKQLDEAVKKNNTKTKMPDTGVKKSALPNAASFAKSAEILAGENPEIDAILKRMERLQESQNGEPSLDDQLQDMLENGVGSYDEFKDVFDQRLDNLMMLRNEINAFLNKNKGLLSQVTAKQKKRFQGVNALLQYVEKEINNSSKVLFNAMEEFATIDQMMSDESSLELLETQAALLGDSNVVTLDALKMIKSGDYKNAKKYKPFEILLLSGELNIAGQKDKQLGRIYNNLLGNGPVTDTVLNQLFTNGSNAEKLLQDIAKTLSFDLKQNVIKNSDSAAADPKAQAAILNSPEIKTMTKLVAQAAKADIDSIESLKQQVEKAKLFVQKMQEQIDKMPDNHPQKEGMEGTVIIMNDLFDKFKGIVAGINGTFRDAQINRTTLDNLSPDTFFADLSNKVNNPINKAFRAFAKSEYGEENIDAFQDLTAGKVGDYFIQKYLINGDLNVSFEVTKKILANANKTYNPTTPFTKLTDLNATQLDAIFAVNSDAFNQTKTDVRTNISDTFSRFRVLSAKALFRFS